MVTINTMVIVASFVIIGSEAICKKGWVNRLGTNKCYLVHKKPGTWEEVEKECQSHGGHLASMEDKSENMFAISFESSTIGSAKWVGIKDKGSNWSDGSPLQYSAWKGDNSKGSCTVIKKTDWISQSCDSKALGICKTDGLEPSASSRAFGSKGDKECGYKGWFYREGTNYCYKETGRTLSWIDSENLCDYWGGHLTSIEDEKEQEFLKENTWGDTEQDIWIGLHRIYNPTFEWVDGSNIKYQNWAEGEHEELKARNYTRDLCVKLNQEYKWEVDSCEFNVKFYDKTRYSHARGICKKDIRKKPTTTTSTTTTTTTTTTTAASKEYTYCENGMVQRPDSDDCYQMIYNCSWHDCEDKCLNLSAHLASFHSLKELYWIQEFVNYSQVWLGMHKKENEEVWSWSDNTTVVIDSFDLSHEGCVSVHQKPIIREKVPCETVLDGVCKAKYKDTKSTTTIRTTTSTKPTTKPAATESPFNPGYLYECEQDWVYRENSTSCYRVTGRYLNWKESEAVCLSLGGHLSSVGSMVENEFLYEMGWLYSNDDIWLGLSTYNADNHRWTDESELEYKNWFSDAPNRLQYPDKCVKMVEGGQWVNVECTFNWRTLKNYRYKAAMGVCKKPAEEFRPL